MGGMREMAIRENKTKKKGGGVESFEGGGGGEIEERGDVEEKKNRKKPSFGLGFGDAMMEVVRRQPLDGQGCGIKHASVSSQGPSLLAYALAGWLAG